MTEMNRKSKVTYLYVVSPATQHHRAAQEAPVIFLDEVDHLTSSMRAKGMPVLRRIGRRAGPRREASRTQVGRSITVAKWTEEKIAELEQDGRSCGTRAAYKPWLEADFRRTTGRIPSAVGDATDSEHRLPSALVPDKGHEWGPNFWDIWEQWPLPAPQSVQHPAIPVQAASPMQGDE